ncbi:MAG: pspE [Rickettsiaceae bacterium]|jgi:rhodanese-related sulfurtransferase|nr:pspE [Rickettsiaceae bacterium]
MDMSIKNISSEQAWINLMKDESNVLIDVRTESEWHKIGKPKLQPQLQNELLLISWRVLPEMSVNPDFIETLKQHIKDKNTNIYFLCRSGARSFEAAAFAESNGYVNCFNIADGFEGSHFGLGWKSNNLPWEFLENVS